MSNIFIQNHSTYSQIAKQLSLKAQVLISDCLDLGLIEEAKELQQIDNQLIYLLAKGVSFDFVDTISSGSTLLVGEGNLSFAYSLTKKKRISPKNLIATTFENEKELSYETFLNKTKLEDLGVIVIHGVDATNLSHIFGHARFNNIVFQFPHSGSREPIEGRNPNFILVREFLKSAKRQLKRDGVVLITTVDNTHYRGAFQFTEAAEEAGFREPVMYRFAPSHFYGYVHTMTNEDESAIDDHKKFGTWVFRL